MVRSANIKIFQKKRKKGKRRRAVAKLEGCVYSGNLNIRIGAERPPQAVPSNPPGVDCGNLDLIADIHSAEVSPLGLCVGNDKVCEWRGVDANSIGIPVGGRDGSKKEIGISGDAVLDCGTGPGEGRGFTHGYNCNKDLTRNGEEFLACNGTCGCCGEINYLLQYVWTEVFTLGAVLSYPESSGHCNRSLV